MQNSNRPIAVFGLFGSSNLGNEATLAAFLQNTSLALDRDILSIVGRSSTVDRTNGVCDMDSLPVDRFFWWLKPQWLQRAAVHVTVLLTEALRRRDARKVLQGVHVLVVPGTGIIDDYGQDSVDLPLHLDRWTAAAVANGARVVFASIGVSTVASGLSRRLFARSLRRCDYCTFRDDTSLHNARTLGYRNGLIAPDLALSLHADADRAVWPPKTIGVGLMSYFGWNVSSVEGERIYRAYIDKMCLLIEQLLHQGYTIRVVNGDTSADRRARADVVNQFNGEARLIAPDIANYEQLIDQIAQCDIIAAARYHNVLLSLLLGRPTISIGYSDKNDALMKSVHLPQYCHAIETFQVRTIVDQIAELAAFADPAPALRRHVAPLREQVMQQYDVLQRYLSVTESERPLRTAH